MAEPVPASVLFLRMRAFPGQPVAEQAARRERLLATVRRALAAWPAEPHVVLEAPDGLAIVARGHPAMALGAAREAAAQREAEDLLIGLHHGLVKADPEAPGGARVSGEGLETAAAVAALADDQPFLASQSFRRALAAYDAPGAEALRPAGEFVDSRLHAYPLYAFDARAGRRGFLRRFAVHGTAVVAILAAGYGARLGLQAWEEARRPPAVIRLDIRPAGEVYVDGQLKGTSPPLTRLTVPAGPHVIEIRRDRFKPVRTEVQLQPGEQMDLQHQFVAPPPPPAPRRTQPRPADWLERLRQMVR